MQRPLLIYIPGMEGTGKLFYRQKNALARHYEVCCLACRSESPFDYNDLTEDILRTIENTGEKKATIVAESFGGTVALQFALKHQDRLEELILINTFPYFRNRMRLRLALLLLPLTFMKAGNAVRKFVYRTTLRAEGVQSEDIEKLFECTFSHGYAASKNRLLLIRDLDLRDRLTEIGVPVTLIASQRDKIVASVREARYMAEKMPNARVIVLPEHGHTPLVAAGFSLASVLRNSGE